MTVTIAKPTTRINLNYMKYSSLFISISLAFVVGSLYLCFTKGFNLGVDFKGGTVIELRPEKEVSVPDLRKLLDDNNKKLGITEVSIQKATNNNDISIKLATTDKSATEFKSNSEQINQIKQTIADNTPAKVEFLKIDYVGPQVGKELIGDSAKALIISILGILIYIWFRFEWNYSIGIIVTIIHDTIIILGLFSFLELEFNLTSIAALLTVIGYSINDNIIIYDRVRENLRKFKKMEINELLNLSVNETMSRTILTSGITLSVLMSLILFGGITVYSFSLAVFVGIVAGTYSSIFIGNPILKLFLKKEVLNRN